MFFRDLLVKIFYKFLILLCILLILDFVVGKTLKHFYFTQTSGAFYRTTYSMDSTNSEILIFGSSRANPHYDTRILADSLGMTCYNTGRDGNGLLYNYVLFETIIKRYTPKIIIFDLGRNELSSTAREYERLSSLLPYLNKNEVINRMIFMRSHYEKLKCLSRIYPFNSLLLTIFIGNTELNKKNKSDINGYVPLTGVWKDTVPFCDAIPNYNSDLNKNIAIRKIIKDCKTMGIRLVLVKSPAFVKVVSSKTNNQAKDIAFIYKVEYLDYLDDTIFLTNHEYFVDPGHLNEMGAKIFTESLICHLRKTNSNL